MKKAVFLDRDGTLNPDPGYISRPDDFALFPGVADALAKLQRAGYLLILITNQSGIARGLITLEQLTAIHARMQNLLAASGASIDAIYYCPHHPDFPAVEGEAPCNCRKPLPGLIKRALGDHQVDPAQSFMVGDRSSDVKIALATGVQPIFIGSAPLLAFPEVTTVTDLVAAAAHIMQLTFGHCAL